MPQKGTLTNAVKKDNDRDRRLQKRAPAKKGFVDTMQVQGGVKAQGGPSPRISDNHKFGEGKPVADSIYQGPNIPLS